MRSRAASVPVLLRDWESGDAGAAEALFPLVNRGLRELTRSHVRYERPSHTLQQTALIYEVYLRIMAQRAASWENRQHFFSTARVLMRRILLDYARRRNAAKRGEGGPPAFLDTEHDVAAPEDRPVVALSDVLADLECFDPQKARSVELRFFIGLSMDEIASATGLSVRTINREWTVARAWPHTYLSDRA